MEADELRYKRFLEGDESAFEEIMETYRFRLIFFLQRYVGDPDTAEDIAMDVFCYVLMHPKRFRFGTKLSTYLFMLAKSRALDFVRHRDHFRIASLDEVTEQETLSPSLEEEVLRNEIQFAVNHAISRLSTEMQIVIHLIYFENLSYKEAAKVMKKSTKQIDNLIYRAKEKLRNVLGKEGEALL